MMRASASCLFVLSLSISVASRAEDPATGGQAEWPGRKVATFSICAADPETGVCGAAVASMYPDVGRVVPYVRAGVGAFCTQHYHVPAWGERALDLLAAGKSPQGMLAELLAGDEQPGMRQLGVVNAAGQTAQHNPTDAPPAQPLLGRPGGALLLLPRQHADRPHGHHGDGPRVRGHGRQPCRPADGRAGRGRLCRRRPSRPPGRRHPRGQTGRRRILVRAVHGPKQRRRGRSAAEVRRVEARSQGRLARRPAAVSAPLPGPPGAARPNETAGPR